MALQAALAALGVVPGEGQPFDDGEQILGARRIEQLCAHRDPPRLLPRQLVHAPRLSAAWKGGGRP